MMGMQANLNTPYPLLSVQSGSMVPTLNVGDLIVVQGTPATEIKVHDIIVFHEPGIPSTLIVHRVIEVLNESGELLFRTKGDHNPGPDPWEVPASGLVGKVIASYAGIGWVFIVLDYLRPILWVALAITAIIFFMLYVRGKPKKTENVAEEEKST